MSQWLRAGREDEAEALSELAIRSKAHWGYDEAFLSMCRDELRLRAAEVVARRTTVAEEDGRIVGFATLDGDAPDGELGMLFVDSAAIGRGVGRLLYRHVLEEAGRLGFRRLTIESDPHAEAFYLAMGAQRIGVTSSGSVPGRGLPLLSAWPRAPEPSWVSAWTGGGRAVHIGNVAEFNAQFPGALADVRHGGEHYACLAAFYSPHPAIVILPRPVDGSWMRGLAQQLGWGEVEVYSGVGGDGGLSESIRARPALLEHIRAAGLPIIPWGRTAEFERITGPDGGLRATRHFESKEAAHRLFRELAPEHPGIIVPAQERAGSRRRLARALAARAAAQATTVVKTEYGVGGSGTTVVTPQHLSAAGGARALARRLTAGSVLLEEYVEGAGPFRDPTFDGVVGDDGGVHPVGVGAMDIDGTSYGGVTVGPGVLPDALTNVATRFGSAVGRALAAAGYRGWYDVDFVTDRAGRLAPTEINLRLTGPAVAFMIQARLARLQGGRHFVRTLDRLPLGARLPQAALFEHLDRVARQCRSLGAVLLPTVPTASFEPCPYVGVALAARTPETLAAAESVVRSANSALSQMFAHLEAGIPRAARPQIRPVRRRP